MRANVYRYDGRWMTLREISGLLGISCQALRYRLSVHGGHLNLTLENIAEYNVCLTIKRNAEIIRKMLEGFHAPASTGTADIATHTGGYSQTFTEPTGTGGGRHALHLQAEKELSP